MIASAFGSMPIGMYALAILLLALDATGSFAGIVAGNAAGNALGGAIVEGASHATAALAAGAVAALGAAYALARRQTLVYPPG